VILPAATSFETSGTFVNVAGDWQSFAGVAKPVGDARPAWKILRVLANFMGLDDFVYADSSEILAELKSQVAEMPVMAEGFALPAKLPAKQKDLVRAGFVPMYAVDAVVRRSGALQATREMAGQERVLLSEKLAKEYFLESGDYAMVQQNNGHGVKLRVNVLPGLPDKTVFVSQAIAATKQLGSAYQPISIVKV